MNRIEKKYLWVKRRIQKEITSGHFVIASDDHNHLISLVYQNSIGDRFGAYLRNDAKIFDINDLDEDQQESYLDAMIEKFRTSSITLDDLEEKTICKALH